MKKTDKNKIRKLIREVIKETLNEQVSEIQPLGNFWGQYHCDSPYSDISWELITTGPDNAGDVCLAAAGMHKGGPNMTFAFNTGWTAGSCPECYDPFGQNTPSFSQALAQFQETCCTPVDTGWPPEPPPPPGPDAPHTASSLIQPGINKGNNLSQSRGTGSKPGSRKLRKKRR